MQIITVLRYQYKEVFNLQNMEVFHVIQFGKVNGD